MLKPLRVTTLVVLLALLALAGTSALMAQSTVDGGINGTVTDQTNAVVAGATVTVRNQDTNEQFTATADSAGGFRVIRLRPGNYEVTVKSGNFAPFKTSNIIVEVGRNTPLEVKLVVGAQAEQVVVSSEAPVINTVQPDFAHNVNTTALNDLPINMRRWSSFAMATPGAVADGPYGLVAFRGISGLLNNNTVDGGDNNNAYFSEERGRTRATSTISQDAVREFQVNNSNFSAEYGRAAGAVVNAVTKSGTNALHGGGRVFVTDSAMWAYNPFSTQAIRDSSGAIVNVPLKPADRRWQFGGNIGGPVKKDKLFFFFNYDQQKENAPGVATPPPSFFNAITVAKPAACSGTLTAGQTLWCRGAVPVFNATTQKWSTPVPVAPGITQAQADSVMSFLAGITGPVERNKDQYSFFPKIDWLITPKHTLTATWNRMRWDSLNGVQTSAVVNRADWGDDFVDVDTVNGRLVSLISNTVTNEFRTSIGREKQYEPLRGLWPGEPKSNSADGLTPETTVGPSSSRYVFGAPYYNARLEYPLENRLQFADSLTASLGNHLLKFGADINHSKDAIDHLYQGSGVFSFSTIADFISDYTTAGGLCNNNPSKPTDTAYLLPCYSSFSQGVGPTKYEFATNDFSFFAQDEWHASRRVTLNLGVRYEYEQLPEPFWVNSKVPQTGVTPRDHFDFGPRAGVAIDLTGNGKTVLRGGYGIYYGRIINAYIGGMLSNTGAVDATGAPVAQLSTGSLRPCKAGPTCTSPLYPNVLTANVVGKPAISVWGSQVKAPQIHEADIVLEREIARNTVASVSYLMSLGRRLPYTWDANLAPSTSTITYTVSGGPDDKKTFTFPLYTARLNSSYNQIYTLDYIGKSRYDGLVFQINRRMTNGLQLSASYTHARSTDTNQRTSTGTTSMDSLDPYNFAAEAGTSGFDIRHRFQFAAVFQPHLNWNRLANLLVNGFSIAPMFNVTSGVPLGTSVSGSATGGISTGIIGTGGSRWPLLPRYSFRGETTGGANLRVARRFKLTEGKRFELIGEVFNLTNHLYPTEVVTTMYSISGSTLNWYPSTSSGLPLGTITNGNNQDRIDMSPRKFQVGARFEF